MFTPIHSIKADSDSEQEKLEKEIKEQKEKLENKEKEIGKIEERSQNISDQIKSLSNKLFYTKSEYSKT